MEEDEEIILKEPLNKDGILICFMIVCLCVAFFAIGYGAAVAKEVNKANNWIQDYLEDYNCYKKEGGYGGFNFNFTPNKNKSRES